MIGCERYYYEMSRYFPQIFFYRVAVRSIHMTVSLAVATIVDIERLHVRGSHLEDYLRVKGLPSQTV